MQDASTDILPRCDYVEVACLQAQSSRRAAGSPAWRGGGVPGALENGLHMNHQARKADTQHARFPVAHCAQRTPSRRAPHCSVSGRRARAVGLSAPDGRCGQCAVGRLEKDQRGLLLTHMSLEEPPLD